MSTNSEKKYLDKKGLTKVFELINDKYPTIEEVEGKYQEKGDYLTEAKGNELYEPKKT